MSTANTLFDALQTEVALLQAFNEALAQETEILLSRHDEAALDALNHQKILYAEELEAAHQLRAQLLEELGYGNNRDSLEQAGAAYNCRDLVSELFNLATQARQQNETNGSIIQTYLEHNQHALNALTSFAQSSEKLYDARGRSNLPRPGKPTSIKA